MAIALPVVKNSPSVNNLGMIRTFVGNHFDKVNGTSYYEIWEGPLDKATAFYANNLAAGWHIVDLSGSPGTSKRQVRLEAAVEDQAPLPTWQVVPIEISKDLKQHPYWRVSGAIFEDLRACDYAIEHSWAYDPATAGAFEAYLKQYYGMRLAGIDSYTLYGIEITSTIRVSDLGAAAAPGQGLGSGGSGSGGALGGATLSGPTTTAEYDDVNRVVPFSKIGCPGSALVGALATIKRLKNGCVLTGLGGTTIYPHYADDQYEADKWEWLKCMPTVSILYGGHRYEVARRWKGAPEISSVLYGGNWNPTAP